MPLFEGLVQRLLAASRIFWRQKGRRPASPMGDFSSSGVPRLGTSESDDGDLEIEASRPLRSFAPDAPAENTFRRLQPRTRACSFPAPPLRKCFSESDLPTRDSDEILRRTVDGRVMPQQSSLDDPFEELVPEEPIEEEESISEEEMQSSESLDRDSPEGVDSEVPPDVAMDEESLPGRTLTRRNTTTSRAWTTSSAVPFRENNRILALPAELRMLIYDELLAIPRTIYMLEADKWEESHIQEVQKFDRELFSRRCRLRYKYLCPCVGYYDPRTTTFAARFNDDENCMHRIWPSETHRDAQSLPASAYHVLAPVDLTAPARAGIYVVFPVCSETAHRRNEITWARVYNYLRSYPQTLVLELEFHKLCSMVTMLKFILRGRLPGWRDLRQLSVLRIRLRHGNGGPLNVWEMATLLSVSAMIREEMERKVLLRRGPEVEISW